MEGTLQFENGMLRFGPFSYEDEVDPDPINACTLPLADKHVVERSSRRFAPSSGEITRVRSK
ncbi:hypothetical protein [Sphingomonas sp.]|uniref:hypothetical protein n=1 Tax=Sphingomonas sp. TaxID=28214 RepID=UPI0026CFCE4E